MTFTLCDYLTDMKNVYKKTDSSCCEKRWILDSAPDEDHPWWPVPGDGVGGFLCYDLEDPGQGRPWSQEGQGSRLCWGDPDNKEWFGRKGRLLKTNIAVYIVSVIFKSGMMAIKTLETKIFHENLINVHVLLKKKVTWWVEIFFSSYSSIILSQKDLCMQTQLFCQNLKLIKWFEEMQCKWCWDGSLLTQFCLPV